MTNERPQGVSAELAARLESLRAEDLDPDFIHLSPTVLERSSLEALDTYQDPVEPMALHDFDDAAPRREAVRDADQLLERMREDFDECDSVEDKILRLMSLQRFRAGTMRQTRFEETKEAFRPTVEQHVRDGTPVRFVLPAFPYKFANPVKVERKSPDMAEVLCLSQLYQFCYLVSCVHPPGAVLTIIADGQLYNQMFALTMHEAVTYREQVADMIKRLGYDDMVEIVDMQDVVEAERAGFDFTYAKLRPVFTEWWRRNQDDDRRASVIRSSGPNMRTCDQVTDDLVNLVTLDILHDVDDAELLDNVRKVRRRVADRAETAAFEYALVRFVMSEFDMVGSQYPDAIRATVHPKPGQWGIHLVNDKTQVFPWQGVAYRKQDGGWRVKYRAEVLREQATPVHLGDDLYPFYYQKSVPASTRP